MFKKKKKEVRRKQTNRQVIDTTQWTNLIFLLLYTKEKKKLKKHKRIFCFFIETLRQTATDIDLVFGFSSLTLLGLVTLVDAEGILLTEPIISVHLILTSQIARPTSTGSVAVSISFAIPITFSIAISWSTTRRILTITRRTTLATTFVRTWTTST